MADGLGRRYFEPFLGGGAFFWEAVQAGDCAGVVLNDVNQELAPTYLAIRGHVEEVVRILKAYEGSHCEEFYYKLRDVSPFSLSLAGLAARMIYLNKAGFNGLYRVNRKGKFNVPWGKRKAFVCDEGNLRACSEALQGVKILRDSFYVAVQTATKGDVVYFDPPYVPRPKEGTASFTSYTADGFGHDQQVRLRDLALELKREGVHVILSNSDTPVVRELYGSDEFTIDSVEVRHNVNRNGGARGGVKEVIVT